PGMGGMQLLERIRRRPEYKTLPIVVATSLANQATVRQAVALHCKHFIVKPFTVQLLIHTVREALRLRGAVLEDKTRVLSRLGIDAHTVQVEVDVATGIPHTQTVGLPDSSVRESKDRVRSALRNAGFEIPPRRITVNLAPAHLRKEGAAYDLPIALALLAAT